MGIVCSKLNGIFRRSSWFGISLKGIDNDVLPPCSSLPRERDTIIPPYRWGKSQFKKRSDIFPSHSGYNEARNLIGNGSLETLNQLTAESLQFITGVFEAAESTDPADGKSLVQLRLSDDLAQWRDEQHALGRILPTKGKGLSRVSDDILDLLGASSWPESLITTNSLFGCGIASLLIGSHDTKTMFSNYVTDMAFYYEHGYHYVYPELESLVNKAMRDCHALQTLGGVERRTAVAIGLKYIRAKIALEERYKANLSHRSAKLDRRMAQTISLCESSLLGMAEEAIVRGFDPAAVMSDLVFSSPGTDVVDVGCDLVNSEVMNSFLNTADMTDTGVVTEDALRRVYDAYAYTGARMLNERWSEPVARMCAALYTWHIQNNRHMFFRRAILGWPKARKGVPCEQREADFDEVFDSRYHTTGFSRPLSKACSGGDTCDVVESFLEANKTSPLLSQLWQSLVIDPLDYVRAGLITEEREDELEEALRMVMARLYSQGLVLGMVWLIAHANHHAWQVNYLFEAAMFGSLLDNGALAGKLDRQEAA
ncbi:hypothetical protein F4778DRAFT_576299 [Xylariomycetidae sp. FL2044]|nr:hypothetical protein F4778DRAFT_576299 [Xylariomycetidae sp. FL2044]